MIDTNRLIDKDQGLGLEVVSKLQPRARHYNFMVPCCSTLCVAAFEVAMAWCPYVEFWSTAFTAALFCGLSTWFLVRHILQRRRRGFVIPAHSRFEFQLFPTNHIPDDGRWHTVKGRARILPLQDVPR